jgi:hypothetical protein
VCGRRDSRLTVSRVESCGIGVWEDGRATGVPAGGASAYVVTVTFAFGVNRCSCEDGAPDAEPDAKLETGCGAGVFTLTTTGRQFLPSPHCAPTHARQTARRRGSGSSARAACQQAERFGTRPGRVSSHK